MSKQRRAHALLPATPLLVTESEDEFDRIYDALDQELSPRGIVLQIYVAEYANLTWEILRLQRCKAGIINAAIFDCVMKQTKDTVEGLNKASLNPEEKKRLLAIFRDCPVDNPAIEAEAIRRVASDLEQLNRMQASLESRRNKILRSIAEYRADFATQVRESADRIIDGKVLVLKKTSK